MVYFNTRVNTETVPLVDYHLLFMKAPNGIPAEQCMAYLVQQKFDLKGPCHAILVSF